MTCPHCNSFLPCPMCGNEPIIVLERVRCQTIGCSLIGPENDPAGEKWNQMAVYVMAGKIMEKFPSFCATPIHVFQHAFLKHVPNGKWWWMVDGMDDSFMEFESWQDAILDAYKTLMEEK